MKKTKWYILIVALVIIESITLFLMHKSFNNKDVNSTNEEMLFNKHQFAIQVGEDSANYADYTGNGIPTGNYILNLETTECRDANWDEITDKSILASILTYDGEKLTVDLNGSIFCNLRFDLKSISEILKEKMWCTGLEDDGCRYTGDNPNNYICFGTSDKETCLNNAGKYLYRIIGSFPDEENKWYLKLIKNSGLSDKYKYNVDKKELNWFESDLYKGLNNLPNSTYENIFINNEKYDYMQEYNEWFNKIKDWKYVSVITGYGASSSNNGVYYSYYTPKAMYNHEHETNDKRCYYDLGLMTYDNCSGVSTWNYHQTKIGLMYASDFVLSFGEEYLEEQFWADNFDKNNSWMYYTYDELIMASHGYDKSQLSYNVYAISSNGKIADIKVNAEGNVRPVFYLNNNIKFINTEITETTGSIEDPFLIVE